MNEKVLALLLNTNDPRVSSPFYKRSPDLVDTETEANANEMAVFIHYIYLPRLLEEHFIKMVAEV